jgi:prophage regulatory protein
MKFLRIDEVVGMTGLGKSTIYEYMKEGRFPASIKIGLRSVAWVSTDVEGWMNQKLMSR